MEVSEYKGCRFPHLLRCPVPLNSVTFATGSKRWSMKNATLDFDVTDGSYRYGREFQIHVWNPQEVIWPCNRADHNGYSRIEIPIPLGLAEQVLTKLLKNLWTYTWKGDV